jgi:hypothetical protein
MDAMRWSTASWLLFVCACGDNVQGALPPSYTATLTSAEPSRVRVTAGNSVTIWYDGELPRDLLVDINGVAASVTYSEPAEQVFAIYAPPLDPTNEGFVRVAVADRNTNKELALGDHVLTYFALPAAPVFEKDPTVVSNLGVTVHPELTAGVCARHGHYRLANQGDRYVTVTGTSSTDPAFTLDGCAAGTRLGLGQQCQLQICFGSTVTGSHASTITVQTDAGDFTANVSNPVSAPTTDLDPTFHGTGALVLDQLDWYDGRGIARPDGNGIAIWSRWQTISVDASGARTDHTFFTNINGFLVNWFRNMRAAAAGNGIYAVVGDGDGGSISTILHYDDALEPDTAFGEIDLPIADQTLGYWRGVELSGGRILAIGSQGVVAISKATRQIDTTWGANGRFTYTSEYRGESVVDSQGRLYLVLDSGVIRLTPSGALDSTFSNADARVIAIDASDRIYVGSATRAARLSSTGSDAVTYVSGAATDDIAVDASGRVYVVSAGSVMRYANDGTSDRSLGFGSTRSIVCPASGSCYLLGVDHAQYLVENYVLRLAD